jgi:hypothetical protein
MLLAVKLTPIAHLMVFGDLAALEDALFRDALEKVDWTAFQEERVVVKGCGDLPVPVAAYVEITRRLQPIAKSIMYGEPCSTVPIYKKQ